MEQLSLPFATQKKLKFMKAARNVVGFILDALVDSIYLKTMKGKFISSEGRFCFLFREAGTCDLPGNITIQL